jgi:rhomboid protease GluP
MASDPPLLLPGPPSVDPIDPVDEHGDRQAPVARAAAHASLQTMLRARRARLIVTPAILAAIVAVFLAMVATSGEVSFSSRTLYRWGAQFGPAIASGQWWRLLTAMWLHANPLHLGLNAIFLWRFGDYVERLLGPVVFLIVYVLAGVVASVVSLQFHGNGLSLGASGALFGLVGVLLTVAMTSRGRCGIGETLAELRPNLVSIVATNLFLGFLVPAIDNAAHIGGLASGLVLGWFVGRHSLDSTPPPRLTLIPIVLTAGIAAATVASLGWRNDVLTEMGRVAARINEAEDAFRAARAGIDAGRRRAADVAADVERTVFPFIGEAQRRADEVLHAAPDVRTTLTLEQAWKSCLAEYDYAWRLRVSGLRDGDPRRVAEGDERADEAIRNMSKTLAGH